MIKEINRALFIRLLAALSVISVLPLCACNSNKKDENIKQGMQFIEQLDYQAALTEFDEAMEAGEDAKLIYRGQGLAHMGLLQYDVATQDFINALNSGHNTPRDIDYDINYYLGVCYTKQELYEDALARYNAIIALRDDEVDAYMERANVYLHIDNHDLAIADIDSALAEEPKNYSLCIDAYRILSSAGFEEEGANYLKVAMDSNDKSMSDFDKGRMCFFLGDYARSRNYLELARKDEDKNDDLMLYLGQSYQYLGDVDYTKSMYEGYLADNPSAEIYNQLGILCVQAGDYQSALEAFEKGLELETGEFKQELKFNHIIANEKLGNYQDAKNEMAQYVEMYPNDEKAKRENLFLATR